MTLPIEPQHLAIQQIGDAIRPMRNGEMLDRQVCGAIGNGWAAA